MTRLIPVVMITGLTDREDKIRGIEAGADDFLNKPIFPEELFARVRSLLKLKEFTDELESAEDVLCTLGLSVEARDPYTEGHCERLARYASELGRHLATRTRSRSSRCAAADTSTTWERSPCPDEILKKGTNLTPEEWEIMRQHPITGETICRPLKSLRMVLPIIRSHHEHWDGSGYPDGLRRRRDPAAGAYPAGGGCLRCAASPRAPTNRRCPTSKPPQTMRQEAAAGLWDPNLVGEFFRMLRKAQAA